MYPRPPSFCAQDASFYNFRSTSAIDFATISVTTVVLLLSVVSLFSICHLRLKSRFSVHLRSFNHLWTVRLLLVIFVSGWALIHTLRLPLIRYLLTFLKQSDLCKLHVVLSLGFLEPGFLLSILFLINASIKKRKPSEKWSVVFVVLISLPTLILQTIFVFFTPLKKHLLLIMTKASIVSVDSFGNCRTICTYPLLSSSLFFLFAIVYSTGLLLAYLQVVSMAINKSIRVRINILGLIVMIALFIQSLFLVAESLWLPEELGVTDQVSFGMFVIVEVCAVVGEVVLVIKPTIEALETGGDSWLNPNIRRQTVDFGRRQRADSA